MTQMGDREKVIKGLEEFVADFKQFCGNQEDRKKRMKVYAALDSLYAIHDLLKEQKENEDNGKKESEQGS